MQRRVPHEARTTETGEEAEGTAGFHEVWQLGDVRS